MRRRNHGTRNTIVVIALGAAAVISVAYLLSASGGALAVGIQAGQPAPNFSLTSVVNGSTFSLADQTRRSDVLLFFNEGLSCSPCLQQMVDLDRQYSTFKQMGVTVVSVTTDPSSSLGTWAANNQISNMMVLSDSSRSVDTTYGMMGASTGSMHPGMAPGHTFVLVGSDGNVIWRKDYGTSTMYVPVNDLISTLRSQLG